MSKICIGIDTGVKTGYAELKDGRLSRVETLKIHAAMECVKQAIASHEKVVVYVEDARLRKWVPSKCGREILQGVGSVKRDALIWEDFLSDLKKENANFDFHLIAPKNNKTKVSSDYFSRLTGWNKRASEHARDAAMLIWGRS